MGNLIGTRNISGRARNGGLVTAVISDSPWGKTYYVQSTHSRASDTNRSGTDIDHPLKTVKQALAQCANTSNNHDGAVILVGEGHLETVDDATSWDLSNDSIQIVGLGTGTNRPTFTFDTLTTSTFTISGAGNRVTGCRFVCGLDAVVSLLTVTGNGNEIEGCEFSTTAAMQPVVYCTVTGDDCKVLNCTTGANTTTAGSTSCVRVNGDRNVVANCYLDGDYSAACVDNTVAALGLLIENNALRNENAVDCCIAIGNVASTGIIRLNHMEVATDAQTTWITYGAAALCTEYENYGANQPVERGKITGTASV